MNTQTGLYQTLVAAANAATQHLSYPNYFLDAIFTDHRPIEIQPGIGKSIDILIPKADRTKVNNIGAGGLVISNAEHDRAQITIDIKDSLTHTFPTWDAVNTPVELREFYLPSMIESILQNVDFRIAGLCVPGAFSVNARVSGAGAGVFQLVDFAKAKGTLAQKGVPIADATNMTFVTRPLTYFNTLATDDFAKESSVGVSAAEMARQGGQFSPLMGATVRWDPFISDVSAGAKKYGVLFHKYAIGMRSVTLPRGDEGGAVVYEKVIRGIRFQFRLYHSEEAQGWLLTVQVGYGIAVVRNDHGIEIETA